METGTDCHGIYSERGTSSSAELARLTAAPLCEALRMAGCSLAAVYVSGPMRRRSTLAISRISSDFPHSRSTFAPLRLAQPAVRSEVVAATPGVIPKHAVLSAFSGLEAPLLAKVARNNRESRVLAALRDTLLPKLISGELRVKEVQRAVEATAP